ncbi:glycosyltransferase [Vibrio alginolyticus]|uniref:glycosyltransferase n=1 Tax=Vibrio alginolyticus TaxID=663 RepID=UPI001BD5E809|nr:glycosyltransferase [Vibrio alginolyticus]MBS9903565.1 glycosyltransferase [Vibrio alginolyticus]
MNDLAPIVLFVYNRPEHTAETLQALKNNYLACESELFIYSDAAKNDSVQNQVDKVRDLISDVSGFKKVTVIKQTKNIGLANSIISGVTEVVNKYGRVIVLEDDIVTSKYFIEFMNESLKIYRGCNVLSISGCNYPIETKGIVNNTYFLRIPLCWGWATWSDKWSLFEKDLTQVANVTDSEKKYINFDGAHDYFKQAELNVTKEIDTWFIFWYITSMKYRMLTLFPKKSLVKNVGHDGSGDNCGNSNKFDVEVYNEKIQLTKIPIRECDIAYKNHLVFFKSIRVTFFMRIVNKFRSIFVK